MRFYVEAEDSLGATSNFPPAGENGGAFYRVQDGAADTSGVRHNIRIVMSDDDRDDLIDDRTPIAENPHRLEDARIVDDVRRALDLELAVEAAAG